MHNIIFYAHMFFYFNYYFLTTSVVNDLLKNLVIHVTALNNTFQQEKSSFKIVILISMLSNFTNIDVICDYLISF